MDLHVNWPAVCIHHPQHLGGWNRTIRSGKTILVLVRPGWANAATGEPERSAVVTQILARCGVIAHPDKTKIVFPERIVLFQSSRCCG
jgi:hypothetical protein